MNLISVLSFLTIFQIISIHAAFELRENENCTPHVAGVNGTCLDARKCESFQTDKNKMKICSFNGKIPIVCCPVRVATPVKVGSTPVKRISARKCEEYAELNKTSSLTRIARASKKLQTVNTDDNHVMFVGGIKASLNEFPHMSAIGWKRDSNSTDWMCGGSLISEKFVLSAAHCASVGRERPDVIRIGDQDLLSVEAGIFPQEVAIKNITIHPQYKTNLKYHDLALFELTVPVTFTKDVSPACLSQSANDPIQAVEAMGYGQTSFAGPQSNALLKGFLTIVNNSKCNQDYGDDSTDLPQGITTAQICAWDPDGNRDTCQGDSGGPLQVTKYTTTLKKYYEIIGVTSFGKFCAAGVPGVYVRVNSYIDWIESVVWPQQ